MRPGKTIRRRGEDERGAVAILVALCLTILMIAAAMVLDFGLARLDRQTNKGAADSAALAGAKAMSNDFANLKPWVGVCTAVRYLKAEFSGLTSASVSDNWADGNGTALAANPCSDTTKLNTVCVPANKSTWASYRGVVTSGGKTRFQIEVRSAYKVSEGNFPEENIPSVSADSGDAAKGGCDNLGVIIAQIRKPGLGSLATTGDVTTVIRSVGRVGIGQNGKAPVALLILEQHDCATITTDGAGTKLYVHGSGDRPGLMHTDSRGDTPGNAGQCNNSKVVGGSGSVKAFKAASGAAGVIGIYGLTPGSLGVTANAYDPPPFVVAEGAPGNLPEPRPLVTRAPVDARYLTAVTNRIAAVNPMFAWDKATAEAAGYEWISPGANCTGSGIAPAYTQAKVYINCPSGAVFGDSTFNGTSMIVNGTLTVKSGSTLSLPNAEQLYVSGPGTSVANDKGIDLSGSLRLHHASAATCAATDTATSGRAELILGSGFVNQTNSGSLLQLCHTTMITMGNTTTMPTYKDPGDPPVNNGRNGYLDITGGKQDWSAPNAKPGTPATQADWDQFEDLAMWTETSLQSRVNGNGGMTLSGIFMLPNANPFKIGGSGTQIVTNSQYIVRKLQASGGGTLDMQPDANDAVQVNYFGDSSLVR